jgi:hypothetical protein
MQIVRWIYAREDILYMDPLGCTKPETLIPLGKKATNHVRYFTVIYINEIAV